MPEGVAQPSRGEPPRFACDDHLAKLARWLRAAGFDTVFRDPFPDEALLRCSAAEGRSVLTRDARLAARAAPHALHVRSERVSGQLEEVLRAFRLDPLARSFTRCVRCNAPLEPLARETAAARIPPVAFARHAEFWRCPGCDRVYWAGTHCDAVRARLEAAAAGSSGTPG